MTVGVHIKPTKFQVHGLQYIVQRVRLLVKQSTLYNLDATVLYIDLVRRWTLMLCTESVVLSKVSV